MGDVRQAPESAQRARFLVVEDDADMARSIARFLRAFGKVSIAGTFREAEAILSKNLAWSAFFFDVGLPDGSGLELLALARATYPTVPALVLTGLLDSAAINATFDLHAQYVCKPIERARIEQFAREAGGRDGQIERVAREWASRYGLSDSEHDVLRRAAHGQGREAIATARGCSLLTVKNQVATLLKKTGDGLLHVAVERLLRECLGTHGNR